MAKGAKITMSNFIIRLIRLIGLINIIGLLKTKMVALKDNHFSILADVAGILR